MMLYYQNYNQIIFPLSFHFILLSLMISSEKIVYYSVYTIIIFINIIISPSHHVFIPM